MKSITPEQIDALLPQTQCGLCGYGGCMPYAEAITFEEAPINLCPPGGLKTLQALGELLQKETTSYIEDMQQKAKPVMRAIIREAECIGCTKCIQACPVDAILGTAKQMHTVISAECTGCELCVAPCPVDCIDMVVIAENRDNIPNEEPQKILARNRYNARLARLAKEKKAKKPAQLHAVSKRKQYIENALARAKAKKVISSV